MDDETLVEENWRLVTSPLGEPWSGRARYAAAMFFYQRGLMNAGALEAYRLSSRLDHQDPLAVIRERGADVAWMDLLEERSNTR